MEHKDIDMAAKRANMDGQNAASTYAAGVPSIGPMSATVQGGDMPGALTDLGGPMLGKTAAHQFERMSKTAQAKVLMSKDTPLLVKLALAMHHTKLSKIQRIKLAQYLVKRFKAH